MIGFEGVGKLLIFAGFFLALSGLLLTFWQKIPFLGGLPGDIFVQRNGFSFFFPLATSLVISVVLTIIINLIFRLLR